MVIALTSLDWLFFKSEGLCSVHLQSRIESSKARLHYISPFDFTVPDKLHYPSQTGAFLRNSMPMEHPAMEACRASLLQRVVEQRLQWATTGHFSQRPNRKERSRLPVGAGSGQSL